MPGLGPTLFELQVRDRMQREAALRQQQQQQSAANTLQEQGNWDRAFKERDQVKAEEESKHKRSLDWAKLKGSAAGISGAPLEEQATPDEQNEAEANQAFMGAATGRDINYKKMAQEQAWNLLGFTQNNANYRARMGSEDRAAALQSREQMGELQRNNQNDMNNARLRVSTDNARLGRENTLAIWGGNKTDEAGKALETYGDMDTDMAQLMKSVKDHPTGTIPGTGLINLVPTTGGMRGLATQYIEGPEAAKNQAALQGMQSRYQKVLTGLTAREKEEANIAIASMANPKSPELYRQAVEKFNEIYQRGKYNIEHRFNPDVINTLQGRGYVPSTYGQVQQKSPQQQIQSQRLQQMLQSSAIDQDDFDKEMEALDNGG